MDSHLDISVLLPSYNSGDYIGPAVASMLAQPGVTIEVLVQDAGSTDGTLDTLESFEDERLKIVSEPDEGQADALNRALSRASGEFILWLNADDLVRPNSVAALLIAAREGNHDVVHGDFDIIGPGGEMIKPYESASLSKARLFKHGAYIFSGSLLIRRELLQKIGAFNADLHYCMDYELYLRLEQHAHSPAHISTTVGQFRRQPESKTETAWRPFAREQYAVARSFGSTIPRAFATYAWYSTYNRLRPVFRSRLWLRLRPAKRLGGS